MNEGYPPTGSRWPHRDNQPIAPSSRDPHDTGSPDGTARGALRRAIDWLLPAENPSAAVYGVIVIAALLSAESPARESYLDTIASAVIATALYWLAHSYATVLGQRLQSQERLTMGSLARALAFDWPLIRGAAIPLMALVVSAIAGSSRGAAVSAAVWSSIASIAGFELVAAVRSHAHGTELAVEILVGLTMGVAILALKIVLH